MPLGGWGSAACSWHGWQAASPLCGLPLQKKGRSWDASCGMQVVVRFGFSLFKQFFAKNSVKQKNQRGFSSYGCFQKWWYPQIIHFNRVFHYKPSILGYPYFRKHPYLYRNHQIMGPPSWDAKNILINRPQVGELDAEQQRLKAEVHRGGNGCFG